MNIFLANLFSKHKLNKLFRDEWIKVMDYKYVDEYVIGGLMENKKKIEDCLNKISEKATGMAEM